jgi:hypothetical protein
MLLLLPSSYRDGPAVGSRLQVNHVALEAFKNGIFLLGIVIDKFPFYTHIE